MPIFAFITTRRCVRLKLVKYVTALGLIAILMLQSVWLYYTFIYVKEDIEWEYTQLLENAVEREQLQRMRTFVRAKDLSGLQGSLVGQDGKMVNQRLYFHETLLEHGFPISFAVLDSLFDSNLKGKKMPSDFVINHINMKDRTVLQCTDSLKHYAWSEVKTDIVSVRLNGSEGVQAVLLHPYRAFFERLGLLLVATILIMFFVAACVVYQIKVILFQNRIARLREDFSYAMIHDMKTPIASILMGVRILHSGKLDDKPEKREKNFRIVEEEAEHLLVLANKVLTLSKLESGTLDLNKQPVRIAPLIRDLVEKFSAKAEKPVSFGLDIETEWVYADFDYLREAISNLIDNAMKYSRETVRIDIAVCADSQNTLIKVKDNGLGISHEDRKKIFEKFERAAAVGRTRDGGATGFGLGLNYVFRVAEAHGGKVGVDSIEEEYSEFTLYLPKETGILC